MGLGFEEIAEVLPVSLGVIAGVIEVEWSLCESLDGVPESIVAPFGGIFWEFVGAEEAVLSDGIFFFLSWFGNGSEEVTAQEDIDAVWMFLIWIRVWWRGDFVASWFQAVSYGGFVDNNFIETFFGEFWEDVFDVAESLGD